MRRSYKESTRAQPPIRRVQVSEIDKKQPNATWCNTQFDFFNEATHATKCNTQSIFHRRNRCNPMLHVIGFFQCVGEGLHGARTRPTWNRPLPYEPKCAGICCSDTSNIVTWVSNTHVQGRE